MVRLVYPNFVLTIQKLISAMYDNSAFPAPLEEETFDEWLEQGRENGLNHRFMIVVWDTYDKAYKPVYVEDYESINRFERYGSTPNREAMVAAYDIYSESKIG